MMEKLKLCMIGATGVGKTSLVTRFVSSIFSEQYQTTIGVRIQARRMQRGDRVVDLLLWDLSGEDEFQNVRLAYLRGAAGYLLVADGTRRETVDMAVTLRARAHEAIGDRPSVIVLNKSDLVVSWEIAAKDVQAMERRGWVIARTSAKTGAGVEEAFNRLVDTILERGGRPWT